MWQVDFIDVIHDMRDLDRGKGELYAKLRSQKEGNSYESKHFHLSPSYVTFTSSFESEKILSLPAAYLRTFVLDVHILRSTLVSLNPESDPPKHARHPTD